MSTIESTPVLPPLKNGIHDISDQIAVSQMADRMWRQMEGDLLENLKGQGVADDDTSIVSIALEAEDGSLVLVAAEVEVLNDDGEDDFMLALLVVPSEHWVWLSEAASTFPPPQAVQ